MSTPQTVPMIAPTGQLGDVPVANMAAAQKAGFQRALPMTSPDGQNGYIPFSRALEAQKAGFKVQGGAYITGMNSAGEPMYGAAPQPSALEQLGRALFDPVGSGATAYPAGVEGVLQSGGRAMQNIVQPFAHPIQTVESAAHAIAHPIDTAEQRIGEFQNEWKQSPSLAVENAAGDLLGAVEGGRITGATMGGVEPSPSLGVLNRIVPAAVQRGIVPTALDAAAKAGLPLAGRALLLGKAPEAAYESALKPSALSPAERADLVQTGLNNGISVSKSGLQRISQQIEALNQQVSDTINQAGPGRTISPGNAVNNLASARARFATQVNPVSDLAAIDASEREFLDQFRNQPGGAVRNMTASEAQAMKQGTYRVLAGKFGEQGSAAVEAQKALARGLKEEIARQFPEINELNATESRLLDLQPVLERAVARSSNHQLIGIGTPIAGAATKAVTGSGAAAAAVTALKTVLDNPIVKSRLAIALSKGGRIPYAQAASRVAAYSVGLGATAGSLAAGAQGVFLPTGSATGGNDAPANQ